MTGVFQRKFLSKKLYLKYKSSEKTNCLLSDSLKNNSIDNKYYIAIWQYSLTSFFFYLLFIEYSNYTIKKAEKDW